MKEVSKMSKKTCQLCNRTYSHSYKLFGRGCFNTECNLLKLSIPKEEKDKEKSFCNVIARRLGKQGISQSKKYELAQKYLTLEYLKKIKYGDLSKEKKQLENEINNVSFTNSVKETIDKILDNKTYNTINDYLPIITLNKAYRLYKTTIKFNQRISSFKKELEKAENDKEKETVIERFLLDDLKFVFDSTKLGVPVYYQVYYAMQVAVWEVVIAGGLVCGLNLSAELLQKSLIANKEKEEEYYITNQERIQELKDNAIIQIKIKELINKYSKHKLSVDINENNIRHDELLLHFEGGDLLYSLHDATINIKGQKMNNKWHLHITIKDKYDFTDPNLTIEEYENSPLARVLNNCGVVSQQYGVIKPYFVYAEFEYDVSEKEVK